MPDLPSKRELLTREEIDALLSGVDSGDVDVDAEASGGGDVKAYDLASQDRVVRGRLPTLELVNEKFARALKVSLYELLRRHIDVGVGGIEIVKFGDYAQSLYVPTSINLLRVTPLNGTAMVVLDAKLVFRLVDQFFGGDGAKTAVDGREFTPTETRMIKRVLECVYADLADAWKATLPIEIAQSGTEVNPSLLNTYASNDIVLVNSYRIELDGGAGEIHFVMPYAMIEPHRELLERTNHGKASELDRRFSPSVERRLLDARVGLNCVITERDISLKEVLRLRAGDVLPIDMPDVHLVFANGSPVFLAKLGNARGNLALEFQEPYVSH